MQKTNSQSTELPPAFYLGQPGTVQIKAAAHSPSGLVITFMGQNKTHIYPWFWVRDHGIDANSLNPATLQRQTNSFDLSPEEMATSIDFDTNQQLIRVSWPDGPTTMISAYMLASVKGVIPGRHDLTPQKRRRYWDKDDPLNDLPSVEYDAVMDSDNGLKNWLENIWIYGFSMVENVPSTPEATISLAERIGHLHETVFGRSWPLSADLVDHGDTAYTTDYLEPHTDGTYYNEAAGLQLFNCIEFDGKGGESIQVDGFSIARRLKAEDSEAFDILSKTAVPGHYIEPGVHLRAERPVIRTGSTGNLLQVSFNNYDRAPFILSEPELKAFHRAYSLFHEHANDQDNWLKIPLTPGRTLIFDNWRNLHGRMGYVGKRRFYGCYLSMAEFESKLRVLQARQT